MCVIPNLVIVAFGPVSQGSLSRHRGQAGSPDSVIAALRTQLAQSGVNYCVGQLAFGDMTLDETLGSVERFVRQVMPAVRSAFA